MYYRNNSLKEKFALGGIYLLLFISILTLGYWLYHPYMWNDMSKLLANNLGFWLLIGISIAFAIYKKIKNPAEIVWYEMLAQIFASSLFVFVFFSAFTFYYSDLKDHEIHNGNVTKAIFEEEWTERKTRQVCNGTDKDGRCTSYRTEVYYVFHPDNFYAITSNSETINLSRSNYKNYISLWGKNREEQIGNGHYGQSSYGDGRTYRIKWDYKKETSVPSAVKHGYINYLKASKSLKKHSGVASGYKKHIKDYPNTYSGKYGKIEINRVITGGINVNSEWSKTVDKKLDKALINMGKHKQVNILVYVVPNISVGFTQALEEAWIFGKKNDVIVLVSIDNDFKINWSSVITFSGNEFLETKLRDDIIELKTVKNPTEFTGIILKNVSKHFVRVPMKELEHLLYDVEIPWWVFFVVLILAGNVSFVVSTILEQNNVKK